MRRRIAIIDGHPDPDPARLCHQLARAYADGAEAAGHEARAIVVSRLDFPLLRSAPDWEAPAVPSELSDCQAKIAWADHLVFVYPLWLGAMPALLKGFLEQAFRPGFALEAGARTLSGGLLTGKSARIVVTMGMPVFLYRWYFRAHSLKSFERNVLRFVGIRPIRETLIGSVAGADDADRARWIERMRRLGGAGK